MVERINQLNSIQNLNKAERQSKVNSERKGDSISLSDEAVKKSELYQLEAQVKSSPDIREDRVQAAKDRLELLLDDKGVLESVAEKLLQVFGT